MQSPQANIPCVESSGHFPQVNGCVRLQILLSCSLPNNLDHLCHMWAQVQVKRKVSLQGKRALEQMRLSERAGNDIDVLALAAVPPALERIWMPQNLQWHFSAMAALLAQTWHWLIAGPARQYKCIIASSAAFARKTIRAAPTDDLNSSRENEARAHKPAYTDTSSECTTVAELSKLLI
jgi:hypothetical protein